MWLYNPNYCQEVMKKRAKNGGNIVHQNISILLTNSPETTSSMPTFQNSQGSMLQTPLEGARQSHTFILINSVTFLLEALATALPGEQSHDVPISNFFCFFNSSILQGTL